DRVPARPVLFRRGSAPPPARRLRRHLDRVGPVYLGPASIARTRRFQGLGPDAPAKHLASVERDNSFAARLKLAGDLQLRPFKRQLPLIHRKPVKSRSVKRGKTFEAIKRRFFVEYAKIAFQRIGGVENSGAAAGAFLGRSGMRRAVGAEEEFGRTRNRRLAQRQPVFFPL